MVRLLTCLSIAIAPLCFSNLARAQDDYSRTGCYLGAAGTVAFSMSGEDALEDASGLSADVGESLGLHARAGCRGGWGGGELHFEWLEGFDAEVDGVDADVDGWALTLDGKFYPLWFLEERLPPLARRFQPFATVGAGYLTANARATVDGSSVRDDDSDFAARFGGGLEVYLTRNIAISVDATYVLPVSDALENFDYLSVGWGALFRF